MYYVPYLKSGPFQFLPTSSTTYLGTLLYM